MGWPKLEDGSIDWKSVFDDPEIGLIVMINNASTPESLRACYHATIKGLFSRDKDKEIRDKYLFELDKFFTIKQDERHLTGLRKNISKMLDTIKRDRIERAREYARLKLQGEERRMTEDDPLKALEEL